MDKNEIPVNRSDANHPSEINPWEKHVIESEPTHKRLHEIPASDTPKDREEPRHDVEDKMNKAAKEYIQNQKDLPPGFARVMSGLEDLIS